MSEKEQVGWIDEFGNCFPLNAWQTTYHDDDKGRWKPLYTAPQSAELDALRSQVAALREALQALSGLYTHAWDRVEGGLVMLSGSVKKYDRAHGVAFAALTDTEAAAQAWERELRNRVLEEQLGLLNKEYDAHDNARDFYMAARENIIRAMKQETP